MNFCGVDVVGAALGPGVAVAREVQAVSDKSTITDRKYWKKELFFIRPASK
jgi:hypothetical protein